MFCLLLSFAYASLSPSLSLSSAREGSSGRPAFPERTGLWEASHRCRTATLRDFQLRGASLKILCSWHHRIYFPTWWKLSSKISVRFYFYLQRKKNKRKPTSPCIAGKIFHVGPDRVPFNHFGKTESIIYCQ